MLLQVRWGYADRKPLQAQATLAWAPSGVAVIETLVSWRWTLNQSVCSFVCLFVSSCRLLGFERPEFQSSHTSSGWLLHWREPPRYHWAHPGQCTGEEKPWVKLGPGPPWLWLPTLPSYGPHALDPMLPFLRGVQDQLQSEALSTISLPHLLSGISRAGIRSCCLPQPQINPKQPVTDLFCLQQIV